MRYRVGDTVVLRSDLEEGENVSGISWRNYFAKKGNKTTIAEVDTLDKTYETARFYWITEDMIDHDATAELNDKVLWEAEEPLSLTLRVHGAKEYRDKLEELHRQIETVEYLIEQLNEIDMKIELKE